VKTIVPLRFSSTRRICRIHPEKQLRHIKQRGYNLRFERFGITNPAEDIPATMIVNEKKFSTSTDPRFRSGEEAENNRGLSPNILFGSGACNGAPASGSIAFTNGTTCP
jgi:hypothetical protein